MQIFLSFFDEKIFLSFFDGFICMVQKKYLTLQSQKGGIAQLVRASDS